VRQGAPFSDVPVSHPYYAEISKLSALGISVGCGSGNCCPDQEVTRGPMAAFLIRALRDFNPAPPAALQ